MEKDRSYTSLEARALDPGQADMVTTIAGKGRIAAQLHNHSLGVFRMSSGEVVHFTFIERGDKRTFGVEMFDPNGEFVGYGPIESVELDAQGRGLSPWNVAWRDKEDRFYIINNKDFPFIRIVNLEIRDRDLTD